MKLYKNGSYFEINAGDEAIAKKQLEGKVMIAIGDSYTVGMKNQLASIARKFGMTIDNRGVVGASICIRPNYDNRRLYLITDTVVSNYTNGKTISGTTYYADDVAVITFMGGANDDPAPATWIGDGLHNTENTLIYGSLNHIFSTLQETFTKAKVICITQPSNFKALNPAPSTDARAQELGFDSLSELQAMSTPQLINFFMNQKERAVRECATAYHLPIVDMFYEFPSVLNPENRDIYWNMHPTSGDPDPLHLSKAGYDLVANAIDRKIVEVFGQ